MSQSDAFLKWSSLFTPQAAMGLACDALESLLLCCGLTNEVEVLERKKQYQYLLEQDDVDESFPEFLQKYGALYKIHPAASDIEISNFETQSSLSLPSELVELYQTLGAFKGHHSVQFSIFSLQDLINIQEEKPRWGYSRLKSRGIVDMLNYTWGNQKKEFSVEGGWLSQQQIEHLNSCYTAIGYIHVDDNSNLVVYFDKSHNFGVVWYDQDDGNIFNCYLYPMLKNSQAQHTLWTLLGSLVSLFAMPYIAYEQQTKFLKDLREKEKLR